MMLLHCHCIADPYPNMHAPAVKENLGWLIENGYIEPVCPGPQGVYTTTTLGRQWINSLTNYPAPKILRRPGDITGGSIVDEDDERLQRQLDPWPRERRSDGTLQIRTNSHLITIVPGGDFPRGGHEPS